MKKIFISFLIVIVLWTTNVSAYQKATASTTYVEEQLIGIFSGVMGVVGALGAAGAHVQDWFHGNVNEFNESAIEFWRQSSPVFKQQFADALTSTADGLVIAGDAITSYLDYTKEFYGLKDVPESHAHVINGMTSSSNKTYYQLPNGYSVYYEIPFNGTVLSGRYSSIHSYIDRNFIHLNFYSNYVVGSAPNDEFAEQFKNASILQKVHMINTFDGFSISIQTSGGDLVYPRNPPLELDSVRDYLTDRLAQNNGALRLGLPANNFVNPYTLDGTKLSVGVNNDLVLPDGRPFEGDLATDVVWNPSIPNVVDIDGTPTTVIDTDVGQVDVITGEVINPTIPTVPDVEGGFWSVLWEWLKRILNAILSIPAAIVSALVTALTALFVPTEDFWQNNFNNLNSEIKRILPIDDYTAILDSLQRISSPQFSDVVLPSIMGSGPTVIVEADYINGALPTIHNWIRGFMFVLLALYNINMIYKLVRGGDAMSVSNARAARRSGSD